MDDWTMSDTLRFCDRIAEEKSNAEFLAAVKNGDLTEIEFELQHGRDPNLPVLKKVQDRADMTTCTSNQRQIGVALSNYGHSYDNYIIRAGGASLGSVAGKDRALVWTGVFRYLGYIKGKESYLCPSLVTTNPNAAQDRESYKDLYRTGFGINMVIASGRRSKFFIIRNFFKIITLFRFLGVVNACQAKDFVLK